MLLVKAAELTKINTPFHIVDTQLCENRSEASKLIYQIKTLFPVKKRALSDAGIVKQHLTLTSFSIGFYSLLCSGMLAILHDQL